MICSYCELGDKHIDLLCELGNIGAGNAATSLSVMLDDGVSISVPHVMIADYGDVVSAVGDPEAPGVAIMIRYVGDVRGAILFIIEYDDAKSIAEMMIEDYVERDDSETLSELNLSTIKEIGNILGSSYLGSIATLTGLKFDISVPFVSVDMIGAIMNAPMVEFSADGDKLLWIKESFCTCERSFKSHVILFADVPSLNTILCKLGVIA